MLGYVEFTELSYDRDDWNIGLLINVLPTLASLRKSDQYVTQLIISKCALRGLFPLIEVMSCGQAERHMTRFISVRIRIKSPFRYAGGLGLMIPSGSTGVFCHKLNGEGVSVILKPALIIASQRLSVQFR